jgi:SAM-dependent methyltransferase
MDQAYSGETYWDNYHDTGLSQELERAAKQEKWLQCFIPVLEQHQVETVLNLGCGSGYDAMKLAGSGFGVSGNDISAVAIEHARIQAEKAGLKIDYRVHDIAGPMPYDDGQFNAVICNLTRICSRQSSLSKLSAKLHDVLQRKGCLCSMLIRRMIYPIAASCNHRWFRWVRNFSVLEKGKPCAFSVNPHAGS